MTDKNVDWDYQGRPYHRRRLTLEEAKADLPRLLWRLRDRVMKLPDGSMAGRSRGGWYYLNENGPDFERPVEVHQLNRSDHSAPIAQPRE